MTRHTPTSTLFPTRRSSDLNFSGKSDKLAGQGQICHWQVVAWSHVRESDRPVPRGDQLGVGGVAGGHRRLRRSEGVGRSEEHTSELQSHHDLVCRLLLEKKN